MKKLIVSVAVLFLLTGCQSTSDKIENNAKDSDVVKTIVVEKEDNHTDSEVLVPTFEDYFASRNYRTLESSEMIDVQQIATIYEDDNGQYFGIFDRSSGSLVYQVVLSKHNLYVDHEVDNHIEVVKDMVNQQEIVSVKGDPIASSPGKLLMVSSKDGAFKEMFNSEIADYRFEDINGDGVEELVGTTSFGGQVIYDVGFVEVFELMDGKYHKSFILTQQLAINELQKAILAYKAGESIDGFNDVMKWKAYLGDLDGCVMLMEENKALLANNQEVLDETNPEYIGYYFNNYEAMVSLYQKRWQVLKFEDELKSIEAASEYSLSNRRVVKVMNADDDASDEILVSYSNEDYTDYQDIFIIDKVDGKTLVTQMPEVSGYYVEDVSLVNFVDAKMIYLKITNGSTPLGCQLYTYHDGKLEEVFNQASPTGSGHYQVYDADLNGIYDEVVKTISDYSVFHHMVQTHYVWKDQKFNLDRVRYALDEKTSEPEKVIYQYFDMLWLAKNYGSNETLTSRIEDYLVDTNLLAIDTSRVVDAMFDASDNDYESKLDISLVSSNDSERVYSVGIRNKEDIKPIQISLRVGEDAKIKSIEN